LEYIEHGNMPQWAVEHPLEFWKAADNYERVNGRPYREIEIALPNELNPEQRRELVHIFVNEHLGKNHPYSLAIHCPQASLKRDTEQPHTHIMFSERKLDGIERSAEQFFKRANNVKPELGGTKKDRDWQKRERLGQLRESWAIHQNRALEKYGHTVRVDHRSLEAQKEAALSKGDYKRAAELDRSAEQHLGPKLAQRTVRMAREHISAVKTPAEVEQKRAEYYERVELSDRSRNVYQIRDYKRTVAAIEHKKEQLRKMSPEFRLAEIKQELHNLGQKRQEAAKEVITEERAARIAQAVYSRGRNKELAQEAANIQKEREELSKAGQRFKETKPGFLDREAKKAYEQEIFKLEQWRKSLAVRANTHQIQLEELRQDMATPEAQAKMEQIKKGVLQKNQPQRELFNQINAQIKGLQQERATLVYQKTRQPDLPERNLYRSEGEQSLTKQIRPESPRQTGQQLQRTASALKRAVDQLSRETRQSRGMRARIFRSDDEERNQERGLER
jgi:hypothetical protein